jgi:photosystem II stability/assembly factor-like uncharacterized protein
VDHPKNSFLPYLTIRFSIHYPEVIMNKVAVFVILILSGHNSNAQWFPQNSNMQGTNLNCVKFVSTMVGWAVGNGGAIIKTTDGGTTWLPQSGGTTFDLYDVSFFDTTYGMAVGGNVISPIILKTTNGGISWTEQPISGITRPLSSVSLIDTNNATAVVSYSNTIIHTTDGGATWILHSPFGEYYYLYAITFVNKNNGTAVGYSDNNYQRQPNGLIMTTTDGGAGWNVQTFGGFTPLQGVSFSDAKHGIAAGMGFLLITKDGGTTWTKWTPPPGLQIDQLTGVSFTDINNCTIVGQKGQILKTVDGGANWTLQASGTGNTLSGVSFTDLHNGTAVGYDGTILRTTNGGVTFIGEEINTPKSKEFMLAQNYPNPFNPSTTIKFSLPKAIHITLSIYNSMGQEVSKLISKDMSAGVHTAEWNASGFASGVYYYRIVAGNFTETKKLLLLK